MVALLKQSLKGLSAEGILTVLGNNYADRTVFSTSFGIEDQVLIHMLSIIARKISVFTLETGRLFQETYYVWNRTLERYQIPIKAYYPNVTAVENMVSTKGPSSFYESIENRKECCYIRKIEPLKRALAGFEIWITGIRAEQSPNREEMDFIEWDEGNRVIKIHPLFHWSLEQVNQFVKQNNVTYNPLHDKGFLSIGCQPCTRAVSDGEDFRSGRWWWEDKSKKECGLHGGGR